MTRKPAKYVTVYSAPVNHVKPQWLIDILKENKEREEKQKLYTKIDQLEKAFDASLGRRARGKVAGKARRLLAEVFNRKFEKKRGK